MGWFHLEYPEVKFKPSSNGKYVPQTINGMQVHKETGNSCYLLPHDIFHDFGLRECPAEPVLSLFYDGQEELVVCTSTDDFLGSTSSQALHL